MAPHNNHIECLATVSKNRCCLSHNVPLLFFCHLSAGNVTEYNAIQTTILISTNHNPNIKTVEYFWQPIPKMNCQKQSNVFVSTNDLQLSTKQSNILTANLQLWRGDFFVFFSDQFDSFKQLGAPGVLAFNLDAVVAVVFVLYVREGVSTRESRKLTKLSNKRYKNIKIMYFSPPDSALSLPLVEKRRRVFRRDKIRTAQN